MKVAVMGAGLSGLACAKTLEENGIVPHIYEKRSRVGDRFVNSEILLTVLERPVKDTLAYLSEEHDINLQPVGNIRRLILYSENEKAVIEGNLGFSNLRGRDRDSFENQLARQVKTDIKFNSKRTYEELLGDYTHVILATGDAAYTEKIQDFQKDLTTSIRGATVEGDFDRYTVRAWMDNRFAPKGYCYFIPMSKKEAHIVIAYPDYPENQSVDIKTRWERFYERACRDLKQDLRVTDRFSIRNYIIGQCKYPRLGNTFFVGNCFGTIMPFLGFGQFPSLLSGIYAAHDICGFDDYEKLTEPLRRSYKHSLVLRRNYERLNNSKMDILVRTLNGPLGEKLFNSRFNLLRAGAYLLKPLAEGMKRKV